MLSGLLHRIRNRFTLFAFAALVLGLGMDLVFSFAPNIVTPLQAKVFVVIGSMLIVSGIAVFIIGIVKKDSKEVLGSISEAYQKISMACHIWKCDWQLYPEHIEGAQGSGGKYFDVWDWMKEKKHPYTEANWLRYRPLFDVSIKEVNDELLEILRLFPNSIEEPFKMEVYNTIKNLEMESGVYSQTPTIVSLPQVTDRSRMLDARFEGVIRCLANLSRKADNIYKEKSSKIK